MEQNGILFTADAVLWKAFVGDDRKTKYVVVKASDNLIDLQRDIIDESVFKDVIEDAKRGAIRLTASHHIPFGFGTSVDAWTQRDSDGTVSLFIMFKLKDTYGESFDLFDDIINGRGNLYQVSVGGNILDYMHKADPRYGVVRVIKKAKVNHVAVTWAGMAVNPRTGFVQAMAKALDLWEKERRTDNPFFTPPSPWIMKEKSTSDSAEEEDGEKETKRREPKDTVLIVREDATSIEKVDTKSILKSFAALWDKLESERRSISYTEEDLEEQERRRLIYGIEVSPLGFAKKPAAFAGIPDEQFADPVNYLFPITNAEEAQMYIKLWEAQPHFWKSIYSEVESAGRVFANISSLARKVGVNVPRNHPACYLVPPDRLDAVRDAIDASWHEILHTSLKTNAVFEEGKIAGTILSKAEEDREALRAKLEARAKKYGYNPAPNAHLTKPAEYSHLSESQFADPVGYNYPIDKEHVLAAIRYFLKPYNRNMYEPQAQKIIYERILRAMKRYGHKHRFNPDNPLDWLMPPSLKRWMVGYEKYEDEDTPEKREEMEKRLEREYKKYKRLRSRQQLSKSLPIPYAGVLVDLIVDDHVNLIEALGPVLEKEVRYGYLLHPEASLYPDDGRSDEDYADAVGFLYPIDTEENARQSLQKFLDERHFFPPYAQVFIYKRILSKTSKEFDPSLPLDWIVAAERNEDIKLINAPEEVKEEQVQDSWNALMKEYMEHAEHEMMELQKAAAALHSVLALISRRINLLSKTLTAEGATGEGADRGIFSYWVIGQPDTKVSKPGPITYVVPYTKLPVSRRKKDETKYPVTDLSVPIAVVGDVAKKIAEKVKNLGGAKIEIKKGDNSYEVKVMWKDKDLASYLVYLTDGEAVVDEKVTIQDYLEGEALNSLALKSFVEGELRRQLNDDKINLVGMGNGFVVYQRLNKTFFMPYIVEGDSLIFETASEVEAEAALVPSEEKEAIYEIIYSVLMKHASDKWRDYIETLSKEI